jgi:hypothetical protein
MRIKAALVPILAAVFCLFLNTAWTGETPGVRQGFKVPTFTVPYAKSKPPLNGAIENEKWQGALSFTALLTTEKAVSPRQVRWWMMWDEDNLYVAMRSPFRPGERPLQALRGPERQNVVFDDSYEIWIDMGTIDPKTGLVAFFQFLSNFAGTRFEVVHQPSVGNSSFNWHAGWEPKNRLTPDGKAWEMTVAIPRASIFKKEPLADGLRFRCLLSRNFKRPWDQDTPAGCGVFNSVEVWPQFVLSKSAPALHLLSVGDPATQTFGLKLAAFCLENGSLPWSFTSDSGVKKEGLLALKKNALAQGPAELALDTPGHGDYRIQVHNADNKTLLLDWAGRRAYGDLNVLSEKLEDTKGDQVSLSLEFNPVRSYVRATGDFINYDNRAAIDHCQAIVSDQTGKVINSMDLHLDALAYVRGLVNLPPLAVGEYKTRLICFGKDGKEILSREEKFAKKDEAKEFPWWKTPIGNIEKVIDPWTPVTVKDDTIGVWGRSMTVGEAGLPEKIISQGQPLIAGPGRLELVQTDGKTAEGGQAKTRTVSQADHRVVLETSSVIGELKIKSTVTVEFDGMYKVEMQLTPPHPMAVKALKVVLPLAPAVAEYLHGTGEGIRTGFQYCFLPKEKQGRLWDSRMVDSQPMAVGSFFPYLWVGNTKGGLAWFADSDEGWMPNNDVPAIEIRRDSSKSTDLVLNLISAPATLDKPRTIVFALQATPVKPFPQGWRMDSWWTGDTFQDFSCSGDIIWTARPFTMDKEKCIEMVKAKHNGTNDSIFGEGTGSKAWAVPYFIHDTLPADVVPEIKYFGEEWRTSISACLFYGETLTDYMIWHLYNWAKECDIDGYYIDNMRPVACANISAGRGWRLPDGRIQPTYQMFSTRRYFLRMRAAFHEAIGRSKIAIHMTNKMIAPWVEAADIALDGEHNVLYPESGKDFLEVWSLERLRSDYPAPCGIPVSFLQEHQGPWKPGDFAKVMRAYSAWVGMHDALPSGNPNRGNTPFWTGRHRFGIETDDVRFIPYWGKDGGLSCDDKQIYLAGWVRPGKALVLVVNTGEAAEVKVNLDAKKLGLPAPSAWKATDAEEGTTVVLDKDPVWEAKDESPISLEGTVLKVPVKRHDYRQIIVNGL